MTAIAIEIIVRETSPRHQPGGFSDLFGAVTVRVAVDTIEHFVATGVFFPPISNECLDIS